MRRLLAISCVLCGCADGPSLIEDGPNDGPNLFAMSVGDEFARFSEAAVSGSSTEDRVTILFSGSGFEGVELFSIVLSITLFKEHLPDLVGGAPQTIEGHLVEEESDGGITRSWFQPGPNATPALQTLKYSVMRSPRTEFGPERAQGSLHISHYDGFTMTGSLDLLIDRSRIGSAALNHNVTASFDVHILGNR